MRLSAIKTAHQFLYQFVPSGGLSMVLFVDGLLVQDNRITGGLVLQVPDRLFVVGALKFLIGRNSTEVLENEAQRY